MDDKPISDHDLYLSLHGMLMALVIAQHQEGRLPTGFFQQMKLSSAVLENEGRPDAARLVDMYAQELSDEFQKSKPSGG